MRAYAAVILSSILFSLLGTLITLSSFFVPAETLGFFKNFFMFIFLVPLIAVADRNFLKIDKSSMHLYVLIGFIYAISIALFCAAFAIAPVSNVMLLDFTYPFIVFIAAYFILGEKASYREIIGLIIAFAGLMIMNPLYSSYTLGNLLALINAVFYGLVIVLLRKANHHHSIGLVFWYVLFSLIFLLPFPILYGIGNLSSALVFLIIAGITSAFAILFMNYSLENLKAETVAIIALIVEPLCAILFAFIILGQVPANMTIIGGAVILIGGILVSGKLTARIGRLPVKHLHLK